jgi:hypothetical protein
MDFAKQLQKILEEYKDEVQKAVINENIKAADELIEEIKNTAPRDDDSMIHMADTWTKSIKTSKGVIKIIIHNPVRSHYPHIIEFGHLHKTKNGYVHVLAQPFLRPAYEKVIQGRLVKNVELIISGRADEKGKKEGDSLLIATSKIDY